MAESKKKRGRHAVGVAQLIVSVVGGAQGKAFPIVIVRIVRSYHSKV